MTTNQYYKLAEHFAAYANKETTYKHSTSYSNGKKVEGRAYLKGIGMQGNEGRIILAAFGYSIAIPYQDVKLPRLAY